MSKDFVYRWGILPLWLLLTASIYFRNPIPIDETRYLSVAWEMWLRGDFLVPYLNGHTYSHKPPLLFWLFQGGWWLFGVNEWWPRWVGPICALINLGVTRHLAYKLWPEQAWVALTAPWILIATLLWTLFATSTMFDTLLTCCVLLGMLGLFEAAQGSLRKGWSFFALAIGLGLLAKGPVIFLHLWPTALLTLLWAPRQRSAHFVWLGYLLLASLAGIALALCWALPAAAAGGEEYASAILWHQTADRAVATKIHARSWFWYLPFVPLLLFPWISWPRFWQNLRLCNITGDQSLRFSLTWLLGGFVLFSLLPSKQLHYLIPLLPAFALVFARILTQIDTPRHIQAELLPAALIALVGLFLIFLPQIPSLAKLTWVQSVGPSWGLSVIALALALASATVYFHKLSAFALSATVVVSIFIGFIFFFSYTGLGYNLRPAALAIKSFTEQNIPVVFVGDYQGQFNFLGGFTQPLPVIETEQAALWAQQHPSGYLISLERNRPEQAAYIQPHREHWLVFKAAQLPNSQ